MSVPQDSRPRKQEKTQKPPENHGDMMTMKCGVLEWHFHALEKAMATHSSVLAWRIPGTGEPGGLPSLGSHRVRHDLSDLAAAAAAEWHPQQ